MATTTDTDAAAAAGVAVPVTSHEKYQEALTEASTRAGFAVTADHADADVGWTAQSKWSAVEPQNLPGQVFTPDQLPDPQVAIRAGLPPVSVPESLVVEEEDHPQGPEPWEIGKDPRDVREAIRARTISDHTERAKALEDARKGDKAPAAKKTSAPAPKGSATS